VLQQDPPATTLDQGGTAVRATAATTGLEPPARRSITVRVAPPPAQLLGRPAPTLALGYSIAAVTWGTAGTGRPVHSSTTALGPEEERMTAPAMPTAPPPVRQHSVVPVTPITPEME